MRCAHDSRTWLALIALLSGCPLVAFGQSDDLGLWQTFNNRVALSTGQQAMRYQEADTRALTANGVLDSETGRFQSTGFELAWQSTAGLLICGRVGRSEGATHYDGYLQLSDGSLSPFRTTSFNREWTGQVHLGHAVDMTALKVDASSMQVVPYLSWRWREWQRRLVQYTETYRSTALGIGVLGTWRVRPAMVLEAHVEGGRNRAAEVTSAELGYRAFQPGHLYVDWGAAFVLDLAAASKEAAVLGWRARVGYGHRRSRFGESPVVGGLLSPPNVNRQSEWAIGLERAL